MTHQNHGKCKKQPLGQGYSNHHHRAHRHRHHLRHAILLVKQSDYKNRASPSLIIAPKTAQELQSDYKNRASPSLIIVLKTTQVLQLDYKNRASPFLIIAPKNRSSITV